MADEGHEGGGQGLAGRRVLVVGASSGVGRAVGLAAVGAGAQVALAGRRTKELAAAVAQAGDRAGTGPGRAVAVPGDVRDPGACEAVVARTVGAFGGLDALVYAAAVLPLGRLADTDGRTWAAVLETNLVGAALVTRAALPHLTASGGRAVYLSSDSTRAPRPGVVPYTVSKAGLSALVAGLRAEVGEVAFTTMVLGPVATDISRDWERGPTVEIMRLWASLGMEVRSAMTPEQVAVEVVRVLASAVRVDEIVLEPPPS